MDEQGQPHGGEWQPATSRPGEIFTVEGQIASAGTLARNLAERDPRRSAYRRSMTRVAAWFLAACIAIVVVAALVM